MKQLQDCDSFGGKQDQEKKPGHGGGQLAGSTHRLYTVTEQLETLASKRNLDAALTELGYHLENYFVRIYELRERVVGYLIATTNDVQNAQALKSQAKRADALTALRRRVPLLLRRRWTARSSNGWKRSATSNTRSDE